MCVKSHKILVAGHADLNCQAAPCIHGLLCSQHTSEVPNISEKPYVNIATVAVDSIGHAALRVAVFQAHQTQGMYICAGLVLADFNKHFLGSTYQSQYDTNISAQAVTSAALVAARALHEIASGGRGASELKASQFVL